MAKYKDGVMYYIIIVPLHRVAVASKIWEKIEQRLVRDGVEYQAYLDRICRAGDRVCKEADVPLQGRHG